VCGENIEMTKFFYSVIATFSILLFNSINRQLTYRIFYFLPSFVIHFRFGMLAQNSEPTQELYIFILKSTRTACPFSF